jgi:hypothetical protein
MVQISDKSLVAEKLLLPRAIAEGDARLGTLVAGEKLNIIPGVEALYTDQVSSETFSSFILLGERRGGGHRWYSVVSGTDGLEELSKLNTVWQSELDEYRAARRAEGQISLGETVAKSYKA